VAYTRPRQEKALAADLLAYEVPFYLPLMKKTRVYGKRKLASLLPVFPSYVFFYATEDERLRALQTNRISQVLSVPDSTHLHCDLIRLEQLIASGVPLTVESRLTTGHRVRIRSGPLAGLEGTVLRRRQTTRLLVSVDFLQRGASMAIDDYLLERIG
jgi:transcriptional antiterminator RfaH